MNPQTYSLTPIADYLSLPGQELMDHALKNRLTESPGLLLHSLLCRIVAYALAKHLPEATVDIDILLSLGLVSHSTRIIAEEWIKGIHPNPEINQYMQTHSNIDFAHRDAMNEWFSEWIIQGIQHFTGNPKTRTGYFPHETMILDNGEINWTETLYQIASWSIAGGITTLDKRFDDLRARRSEDIGKLELDYIREKMNCWGGEYMVPQPILDEAGKDLWSVVDNKTFQSMLMAENSQYDSKKIWTLMLNSYQTWADSVRKQYCGIVWIDNFDIFLQQQVDTVQDPALYTRIKLSFESAIGRPLRDDEFFPTIPGIEMIYKRIWTMKVDETRERATARMVKLMWNIDRVARPFLSANS